MPHTYHRVWITFLLSALLLVAPFATTRVQAGLGDCAQPISSGANPVATDCLYILSVAVGAAVCATACICAPTGLLPALASDALLCLKRAVGQSVTLACPCASGFPADPADYSGENGSYLDTVSFPIEINSDADPDNDCCKDFGERSRDFIEDGTNEIDNAITDLVDTVAVLSGIDLNTTLADVLTDGSLVTLLDHRDLDTGSLPAAFTLTALRGSFATGTDVTKARAGQGEFVLDLGTFVGGTGTPHAVFGTAQYTANTMTADDTSFNVVLPLGNALLEIPVSDVSVEGTHSGVSPAGVGYTGGSMAGVVTLDDFMQAINAFVQAPGCSCLGLSGPAFTKDTEGTWQPTGCAAPGSCSAGDDQLCVFFGETLDPNATEFNAVCELMPFFVTDIADIDVDGQGVPFEGLSVGWTFTAVPASIAP